MVLCGAFYRFAWRGGGEDRPNYSPHFSVFVLSPRKEEKAYVYLRFRFPPLWCSKSKLPWLFYKCFFVYSVDNEVLFY